MHLNFLDWSIIGGFFLISWLLSNHYRNVANQNLEGLFLGGKNLPWWLAGLSMVATTFAADTPLAVAEIVAVSGISGNWLWWNALAGGMLTALFFSKLWQRSGVLTEAEFISIRYAGKPARYLRAFKGVYLGLLLNMLVIGWVNLAMISIFSVLFNVPESQAFWLTAGLMLFVSLYSSSSGLKGIAVVDMLQFSLAMLSSFLLAYLVIKAPEVGGIAGLKEKLAGTGSLSFFPQVSHASAESPFLVLPVGSLIAFLGFQWWSSWYPGAEPGGGGYIAQRMMSTKSDQDAMKATLLFQFMHYVVRPWPWILVGLAAIVLYPELAADEKRLGYVQAVRDYLPAGVRGLMVAGFIGAYMSTISTQLNWGASMITNDVFKPFSGQKDHHKLVRAGRIFTLVLMLVGLFVSSQIESIKSVWEFILQTGAGLGGVLILRWYWWRINVYSEISAMLAPAAIYAWFNFSTKGQALAESLGWGYTYILVVLSTTVIWLVVTLITPAEPLELLKKFHQTVRPNGFWSALGAKLDGKALLLRIVSWLILTLLIYVILLGSGYVIFEWFG